MQLYAQRERRPAAIRLTAMVDVVFLLIIFFMTVSQLNRDILEEIPLPVAREGRLIRDRDGRVVLNVMRDGRVVMATKELSLARLTELLHRDVATRGADEIVCVLRVHRRAAFDPVRRVMGALAEAGVWRVTYSVVEQD